MDCAIAEDSAARRKRAMRHFRVTCPAQQVLKASRIPFLLPQNLRFGEPNDVVLCKVTGICTLNFQVRRLLPFKFNIAIESHG
jgi:hypothetical protein